MNYFVRCLLIGILALPLVMVGCTCSHHPSPPPSEVEPLNPDDLPGDDEDMPAPEDAPQDQGGESQSQPDHQ